MDVAGALHPRFRYWVLPCQILSHRWSRDSDRQEQPYRPAQLCFRQLLGWSSTVQERLNVMNCG
ncbi:hypothetical protein CLV24_11535 [Pontibacter ummariensis]|uniref:Uncharacterized protein n=1 Tax=Pontibacter ummariensis TaxID=1610492 RepID=A0A239HZU1_9BACT|nr:hypothetical protein CLV24_11535 [Pontibacter ummariensis]SNS86253.1 hypothetical protein SAMN06296052_11535 [Pontibacter ummariensis]